MKSNKLFLRKVLYMYSEEEIKRYGFDKNKDVLFFYETCTDKYYIYSWNMRCWTLIENIENENTHDSYTRQEVYKKVELLKDWDNHELFHKAVDEVLHMIEYMK